VSREATHHDALGRHRRDQDGGGADGDTNRDGGASAGGDSPLTARSVILSLLLGTEPPRLPVQRLVRATRLFGIPEGTARTALSRMTANGELEAADGWYSLAAERHLARQTRQTASRRADTEPWDGKRWVQAVVVTDGPRTAADRARLRANLAAARLGELREGIWLRPDNLPSARPPRRPDDPALVWSKAAPERDPSILAGQLWDLPAWTQRARALRDQVMALTDPLREGDHSTLAAGFVTSAAVLRHLQADPLLPTELTGASWPGDDLRREYDRFDAAYRTLLRRWFTSSDT
jgi:phenylacetic acid degradation operon negative regulatory protein